MPDYIISFCASCGSQLPTGLGTEIKEKQVCSNCSSSVSEREERVEGLF